jgi:hypothetical protein
MCRRVKHVRHNGETRKRVKPYRVFQNDWTSLRAPMVDRTPLRLLVAQYYQTISSA